MAKTLVNTFSCNQKRLERLYRDQQWVRTELNALPQRILEKEMAALGRYGAKLNRRLLKCAFATCDKVAYAEAIMAEKLQKYDVKHYMDHRAINHACLKEIFNGKAIDVALAKQKASIDALAKKRSAYVAKLESRKQIFLTKYNTCDPVEYEQQKESLSKLYEIRERELDAKYSKYLQERTVKLNARMATIHDQIARLEAKRATTITLPNDVLLRIKGLKMYFGGLKAVDDLTFDVKKGEIFGLIGPNGAGKTTVFNCITRFYDATAGEMYFENKRGEVVDLRSFRVHNVITQGITRTFQNVELVKEITVLDNLLVACTQEYRSNLLVQALGLPSLKREDRHLREKAMHVLKFMGLENYAGWLAFGLPYGILKKVEIARALMSDSKLIIMDEPAAGLNDSETAELTQLIRRIRDEYRVTILLVEHDMGLVMDVCDTVCAISFGKMLAIDSCDGIKKNKTVQEAYLGVEGEM